MRHATLAGHEHIVKLYLEQGALEIPWVISDVAKNGHEAIVRLSGTRSSQQTMR